jgi:glutamyl-tRNA synthetase
LTKRVRFAPSPTGYLHVGNARIALANWLLARRDGGSFLLRLDDTDTERNKPEYEAAIQQDLRWLGLDWDSTARQSDRLDRYTEAAERLKASGRLYPCFESEEELKAKREMRLKRGQPPVYDRGMLKLTPEQRAAAEANGKRPYWRFLLTGRTVGWDDLALGHREVKLPTVSDPVLIRADGTPLYTFTSVVDDLELGITDVVRGEDHVTNTGVQIDLWEALGGNPSAIRFGHLPLLVDESGGKLSKRLDSLTLRGLARDGVEPITVTSYLARLGSGAEVTPLPFDALAQQFDLRHFGRSSPRFDGRQLMVLNAKVLHGLEYETVRDRLPPAAPPAFWNAIRGNLELMSEARGWWDVVGGDIVPPVIEGERDFLTSALDLLPPEPWDGTVGRAWLDAVKKATGRSGKKLFAPLRLALTGEEHGPDLVSLLPLMGRHRAASRLQLAAS